MSGQSDAASDSKISGAAPKEDPEVREPDPGLKTLLEQQSAMMTLMMQQVKDLQARVEVAEETFSSWRNRSEWGRRTETTEKTSVRSACRGESFPCTACNTGN